MLPYRTCYNVHNKVYSIRGSDSDVTSLKHHESPGLWLYLISSLHSEKHLKGNEEGNRNSSEESEDDEDLLVIISTA